MARPLKPQTPLAERLLEVRKRLGHLQDRSGFAEKLGLVPDTLGSYERGIAAPPPDVLARYHKEFGVNISWLVSGDGEPFEDMSKVPSQREAVDIVLLQKIGDRVHTVFIECKQTPPARAEIAEAGKIYNELLKTVPDIADGRMVEAVLPVLLDRFKERIATAEPGAGKRSA